jgi:S-DNA-T family DNA segregation ATPase FtsK/SpoIIIE
MAVPAAKRRKTPKSKRGGSNNTWLDDDSVRGWGNEVIAVCCFAAAALIGLSVVCALAIGWLTPGTNIYTFFASAQNGLGVIGSKLGTPLVDLTGTGSLVVIAWLAWFAKALWDLDETINGFSIKKIIYRISGLIALTAVVCGLVALVFSASAGGQVGVYIAQPLKNIGGSLGAFLFLSVCLIAGISIATKKTIGEVLSGIGSILINAPAWITGWSLVFIGAFLSAVHLTSRFISFVWSEIFSGPKPIEPPELPIPKDRSSKTSKKEFAPFSLGSGDQSTELSNTKLSKKVEKVSDELPNDDYDFDLDSDVEEAEEFSHVVVSRRATNTSFNNADKEKALNLKSSQKPKEQKTPKKVFLEKQNQDFADFVKPSFDLLTRSEETTPSEDDQELIQKSRQIELKLRDFNIQGRVTEVHPGPVITLFEFEPAAGVKVGKIAALQDDLAMSLRASSIRIIAPIPKKGTVGIEVPNRNRDMVRLRDVLEHPDFLVNQNLLNIPLGKDTYGDPVYVDISTMPHLLIAGATGTGKSVSINAILLSLLYRASPADLGLILIDPKILELSIYDGIPHLKVPVVTVPKQAKAVLDWAVKEMERRYRMMQKYGVRNIDGYNKIVQGEKDDLAKRAAESEKIDDSILEDVIKLEETDIIAQGTITDADLAPSDETVKVQDPLKPLPKIVIVVDELADLMLTVGRDIEELITRLAQKARAAGIHLILATQRPSVDVITGLIKANFPARISFRVTSRIDSRTILDSMGAERLLGKGDMLFMHPGSQHLRRIHGAFVSDSEVQKVVDVIKAQGEPNYDQRIIDLCEKALKEEQEAASGSGEHSDEDQFDPLYDKAVEVVVQKGQASTSMIQRVFRIGYNRAARIIELMEKEGVIGPMDGIRPREVLVTDVGKNQI